MDPDRAEVSQGERLRGFPGAVDRAHGVRGRVVEEAEDVAADTGA